MSDLSSLFPVSSESKFPVEVKNLHMWLEVATRWNDWFARRVTQYGWVQGVDFTLLKNEHNEINELRCTINMAKELAMIENSEKGKAARAYFLECEQRLFAKTATPLLTDQGQARDCLETMKLIGEMFKIPEHSLQIETVKYVAKHSGVDLSSVLKIAPAQDQIKEEQIMLEPMELGLRLGIGSGREANQLLERHGCQTKINGLWRPTNKGKSYCFEHSWSKNGKSGYNLKWNLKFVESLLK